MRRLRLFHIICLTVAVSFAAAMGYAKEMADQTAPACRISSCQTEKGKIFVKVYPSTQWSEAKAGFILSEKDAVKTDSSSSMVLEFPNKSSVSVRPDTEIAIDKLIWNDKDRKVVLNVVKGEIRTIIEKTEGPSEFKIKTPTTICDAAGTVFYVRVTASGTSVYVSEGSVIFTNPFNGETYTVTAGMMITLNSDGSISGPAPASDTDVTGWTEHYSDAVAEPYTPPEGDAPDVNPPGATEEDPASRT